MTCMVAVNITCVMILIALSFHLRSKMNIYRPIVFYVKHDYISQFKPIVEYRCMRV
jgi:hypothetical protein